MRIQPSPRQPRHERTLKGRQMRSLWHPSLGVSIVALLIAILIWPFEAKAQRDDRDGSPNDFRKGSRQGPEECGPNMQKAGSR